MFYELYFKNKLQNESCRLIEQVLDVYIDIVLNVFEQKVISIIKKIYYRNLFKIKFFKMIF